MIIYIYGQDSFRGRQYLRQTIEQFKQKRDPQGYNVVVLDGKTESSGRVLTEIKTSPFLAERRMIIIENILSSQNKDLLADLIEMIKHGGIPASNIVVFYQATALGKIKEIKELEKLLKQEKYGQEFNLLKGAKLLVWIKKQVEERSGRISTYALDYLAASAGQDMWFLNSLLDQLINYKDGKEIQLEDAQLFLEERADDDVFNMVESIVAGDRKRAFKLLQEQRRLGEDETKLFGLLVWQFRILLEMRDLFDRKDGLSSNEMAKELGIHPFVAKKNLFLIKRYPLFKLRQLHKQLLEIDYKTKTGQADQSLLVDLFVGKI